MLLVLLNIIENREYYIYQLIYISEKRKVMDNESKSTRIQVLEQSLINFLISKKDITEKLGTRYRQIYSIQLSLNNKNAKNPVFIVSMGMISAEFNIMNGLKEKGSCYGIETYIRDWAERDAVKTEMLALTSLNKGGSGIQIDTGVRNTLR